MHCGDSFTTNLLHFIHFTHRRHSPRAFGHVRGRRFPSLQTGTPPRKAGACPLSNQATESDLSHGTPANGIEIATESDLSHGTPANGIEMATESDFPTTPHPMRVESASDGDLLTPEEKGIKRNPRLGEKEGRGRSCGGEGHGRGRGGQGRGRRRGGHHHRVAGLSL